MRIHNYDTATVLFMLVCTIGTTYAISYIADAYSLADNLPGGTVIANSLGVLVAFMISTRFSMASDHAHTIMQNCYLARRLIVNINATQKKEKKHTVLTLENFVRDIENNTCNSQAKLTHVVAPEMAANVNDLLVALDTAKVAYHHSAPHMFNPLMYSLLFVYYGIMVPLVSVGTYGAAGAHVIACVTFINFIVLFYSVDMDHPTADMQALIHPT